MEDMSEEMSAVEEYLLKVLVVGDTKVGKTSLITRFVDNLFAKFYKPSIGANFSCKKIEDGKTHFRLQIWDMGGHEVKGSMLHIYSRDTAAVVLVWNQNIANSLEGLDAWLNKMAPLLCFKKEDAREADVQQVPVLFVKNGSDNKEKVTDKEQTYIDGLIKKYGLDCAAVVSFSAKENWNHQALKTGFVKTAEHAVATLPADSMEPEEDSEAATFIPIPSRPNIFAELLPKLARANANMDAMVLVDTTNLSDRIQDAAKVASETQYDRTIVVRTREIRFRWLKEDIELLAQGGGDKSVEQVAVWLLLHLISIANREKSEVSKMIERFLQWYFKRFQGDFRKCILNNLQPNFCESVLIASDSRGDVEFSISKVVGNRENEMRCVLELLREEDRLEKKYFHTESLKIRIETTLRLADRIFQTPAISKEDLFDDIELNSISDEANEILRHYFPQFGLEERSFCVLQ